MARYKTMTEMATDALRERILTGRYAPGSRLIPAKLVEDLELGRVAIREGLRELTGSGLIIQLPNKGACVAEPPASHELGAIFQARIQLEGAAAYQAALLADTKLIEILENLNIKMGGKNIPPKKFFLLNREFHYTLSSFSGWKHVLINIVTLMDQVLSFYANRQIGKLDFELNNHDHKLILKALRDKNPDKVRDLIEKNIGRGMQIAKQFYDEADEIPHAETANIDKAG